MNPDFQTPPGSAEQAYLQKMQWRIRTVLIAAALYVVTLPLWALLWVPGWIAWIIISLWFLYRIVIGFSAMNKGQEIGHQIGQQKG